MRLISTLKRAKYAGAALVLLLAATPVNPISQVLFGDNDVAAAPADHCANGSRTTLQNNLNQYGEASLCNSNISSDSRANITRDATLELNGKRTNTPLRASGGTVTIIDTAGGGRVGGDLTIGSNGGGFVINSGTFSGSLTANNNGTIEITGGTFSSNLTAGNNGIIRISGGNFTSWNGLTKNGNGQIIITGGTFRTNPTAYVASGYEVQESGSGWNRTYTVVVKKEVPTVTLDDAYVRVGYEITLDVASEAPEEFDDVNIEVDKNNIVSTNGYSVSGVSGGDATITYTFVDDEGGELKKVVATVHSFDFAIEEGKGFSMMEGTSINVNDSFVGTFSNPSVIEVRCWYGGDPDENCDGKISSFSGTTVADGVFTAGRDAMSYELHFYVNGEEILDTYPDGGYVQIWTFAKQTLNDRVLSVSGVGADKTVTINLQEPEESDIEEPEDEPCTLVLDGCNVPLEYDFYSSNEDIVSVSGDAENGYTLTAEGAGEATILVVYGDDAYNKPKQSFAVKVSDFWNDAEERYTASDGDTIEFTVSEEAGQDNVICEVDGVACSASEEFTVSRDDDGKYSILVNENAEGGAHTFTFKDTLIDEEVTVEIYVYEVVLEQTEYYLNVGTMQSFTVQERTGTGSIRVAVTDAAGGTVNDVNVACQRQSWGSAVYNCNLRANKAGQYTIRVRAQNWQGTTIYDMEYITLYAIDFTVNNTAYHIKKGDTSTTDKLINTLNNYWEETAHGNATGFEILKADNTKYYGTWKDAEAGKYAVEFYAFAGPDRFDLENRVPRDTKTVDLYVYEMTVPEDSEYRGEAGDTFTGIDVNDKINVTVPETATITAEVTYGDASAVDLSEIMDGKVTISKPGRYEVTYTDTMANGGVVDTWTATFKVYDLDATILDGTVLDLNAGGKFTYKINPSGTYGLVRTTVKRTGTKGGRAQEVYSEEHRYHGSAETETETEFTFDPAEYGGEGKYTVKMKNLSAEDFGEEVEGTFYAVAKEFELKAAKQGTVVKTTSGSKWSVDGVYINGEDASDQLDGKTLEINTTNLPLGVNIINFVHDFDGQEVLLKSMSLVVYKVVPDKKTDPERITEDTIESLIDALTSPVIDDEAEAKIKAILGEDYLWPSMGLWMSMVEGQEIDTRVQVTDLSEDEVEAEMIETVDALGADHVDYYDVSVLMEVSGVEIGKLHKLNGKLTVALAEVTDPASGYTRQYFVLRDHNGVVTTLTEGVDFYIEDGILYVISDEFSTYAVAYKDTLLPVPKAPDTGDEVVAEGDTASVSLSTAVVLAAAAITLVGAVVFAKRK